MLVCVTVAYAPRMLFFTSLTHWLWRLLSSFTPHRRRDQLSTPQSLPGVSDFQAWKGMTLPVPWPLERDPASCDGWYVALEFVRMPMLGATSYCNAMMAACLCAYVLVCMSAGSETGSPMSFRCCHLRPRAHCCADGTLGTKHSTVWEVRRRSLSRHAP
jgi:hypothetical protein